MSRRSGGFTLIEVMIAVAIITIGSTGLFAMQGATLRANADASETTVATAFASTWLERIKRDALTWTLRGNADLANTLNLQAPVGCTSNAWFVPATTEPSVESAAADIHGFDIDTTLAADARPTTHFCANAIVSPVHGLGADRALPIVPAADVDLLRVTVRVWWARGGRGGTTNYARSPAVRGCVVPTDADLGAATLRTVYLSTLVHWNRYR
jgi:prepilin-type N-terminal cleavage/methylation domain-containing protein